MGELTRGLPHPLSAVRSDQVQASFTMTVHFGQLPFDDAPPQQRQDAAEAWRARLAWLTPVVLAMFVGVIWYAYSEGVDVAQNGGPVLVAAPAGPERISPEELGLRPSNAAAVADVPLPRLKPLDIPPAASAGLRDLDPAGDAAAPAAQPAAQSTPASTVAGPVIQIGSYPTEAYALDAWRLLRGRYAGVLAGLQPDIQVATIARGTFYRLRAGPFADRAAATAACERLEALGGDCRVP